MKIEMKGRLRNVEADDHRHSLANSGVHLLRQVHGDTIVDSAELVSGAKVCEGDAWLVTTPGAYGIKLADCLGVVLWCSEQMYPICVIHSGWRGSHAGIVKKALAQLLKSAKSADNIHAYFGPSARSCCYEVGQEFRNMFDETYVQMRDGTYYFDNVQYNVDILIEAGVALENISILEECTMCSENWFSYRRDKTQQRNLLVVTVSKGAEPAGQR